MLSINLLFSSPFCFQSQGKSVRNHHAAYPDDSRPVLPVRLSAEHVVRFQGSSVATADRELRTQIPGPRKPSLQGAELPIQWRLRPKGGEPCGRTRRGSSVGNPESEKGEQSVFPPRDHAASLVNTPRHSTFLSAPAKFPCPSVSL